MSKVTTPTTKTATKTTKKVTKAKEVTVEAPAPVVAAAPAPAPVATPAATTTAPTETAQTEIETDSMRQRFERLIKAKQDLINDLKREMQELKKMQRDHEHAIKDASKKMKKKKVVRDDGTPRKPSGFASPVVVSDDLYGFLSQFGVKKGDMIARTDVTRHVTNYIKEKDLQNPEHRREIIPDAALKKLFGPAIEPKDPNNPNSPLVYTYLKLQRYLSPHFPKKATA